MIMIIMITGKDDVSESYNNDDGDDDDTSNLALSK